MNGPPVPEQARLLHEQARAAGMRGEYEQALALLGEARVLAPGWAYPVYDAAFTHLLMGDSARAEALYAEVDQMEPRGFFTCKSTLAMLGRERAGELPAGFSKAWLLLEGLDERRKRAVVEATTQRYPEFAPAWKELALLQADPVAELHAIDTGLAADPDVETKGILLINKATALRRLGRQDEATQILTALLSDPSSSLTAHAWAKAMLR
jgi:tetratricopeptide (TPR) repeat protein